MGSTLFCRKEKGVMSQRDVQVASHLPPSDAEVISNRPDKLLRILAHLFTDYRGESPGRNIRNKKLHLVA